MNKDLVAIFEYLEREKGIKRDIVIKAIEEALVIAARKSIQGASLIDVEVDSKSGEIEVLAEKEVVDNITIPEEEILLEEAREFVTDCELGDWIRIPITPKEFGRIAAQTARQVISQKLRGAERDVIYEEYRHRINDIVTGTVKRIVRGATLIVDLGKVEAILPERFYPKTEHYQIGEKIMALLFEVRDTDNGGAEVVLTRSHPEIVKQLFIQEVPELNEGSIQIEKIVREAGYRTKLAVTSDDIKIDPVGACVGVRGTRVKNVIRELNNEKIDIIPFSSDPVTLLQNALAPIEIKKIHTSDDFGVIAIVVDDEDYPSVLGKKGMNARLLGRLVGAELEVHKMTEYQKATKIERQQISLSEDPTLDEELQIDGLNKFILESLAAAGFDTPRKLLGASPQDVAKAAQISPQMADDIIEQIKNKRK